MALPGRAPKDVRLGRGLSAEWTEVPNTPFTGPSPELSDDVDWDPRVRSWWQMVRRMPHAVLWSEMDWHEALVTAYMWQDWYSDFFAEGSIHANKSTEIRRRCDNLGTSMEARRKLRIRYVDTEEPDAAAQADESGAKVTDIKSRRKRLAG